MNRRLLWVTQEQRDHMESVFGAAPNALYDAPDDPIWLIPAYDAAPEPVARQRCATRGHGGAAPETDRRCYVSALIENPKPCRFVTVYEVPAPEETVAAALGAVAPEPGWVTAEGDARCDHFLAASRARCLLQKSHTGPHRNTQGFWLNEETM